MGTIIKGATILTMTGEAPFVGDILFDQDCIKSINSHITPIGDAIINGEGMIAMPGLINAHQHTPMSLLRGFSDDMKLMDWLDKKMLPAEAKMTPEDIYSGAKLSMAEDIRLLSGIRGGVSHNPVSNLKLGCGIAPVTELEELNITVRIGTDGAGSATTLDMFEEIKAATWLQKLDYDDPERLPADQALRMATMGSAKLLNIDSEVGTLEAGQKSGYHPD